MLKNNCDYKVDFKPMKEIHKLTWSEMASIAQCSIRTITNSQKMGRCDMTIIINLIKYFDCEWTDFVKETKKCGTLSKVGCSIRKA